MRAIDPTVYTAILACGCFAVALWVSARYTRIEPKDWRLIAVHLGVTLVIAQFLIPVGLSVGEGSTNAMLAVLAGVVIPTLTYMLLVAVWVVRLTTRMLGAHR